MTVNRTSRDTASRTNPMHATAAGKEPTHDRAGGTTRSKRRASVAAQREDATVELAAVCADLEAAGILLPPPQFDAPPMDSAELERLEQEVYAWLDSLPVPLGLTGAVIEDRG